MRKRVFYSGESLNPFLRKINDILTEMRLSPTSLSTMAGLGSSTLSNLLKRNNIPTFSTLEKICAVLGIRLSSFIKDLEDSYPELFLNERTGIQPYDPMSKRKDFIMDEWAALPMKDQDETIKRMIEDYSKREKETE